MTTGQKPEQFAMLALAAGGPLSQHDREKFPCHGKRGAYPAMYYADDVDAEIERLRAQLALVPKSRRELLQMAWSMKRQRDHLARRVKGVSPDEKSKGPSAQHRAECDCAEFHGGVCRWPACGSARRAVETSVRHVTVSADIFAELMDFVDRHSEEWYRSGQELLTRARAELETFVEQP